MMNTIQILSNLENADFTTVQARAITEAIEEKARGDIQAIQNDIKKLATKEEIKALRDDMKGLATKEEIKALATKEELKMLATKEELKALQSNMATKDQLEAAVAKAKYDLVRWIVGAVVANGLIATLLKFFG